MRLLFPQARKICPRQRKRNSGRLFQLYDPVIGRFSDPEHGEVLAEQLIQVEQVGAREFLNLEVLVEAAPGLRPQNSVQRGGVELMPLIRGPLVIDAVNYDRNALAHPADTLRSLRQQVNEAVRANLFFDFQELNLIVCVQHMPLGAVEFQSLRVSTER
jgi:hypothetical protein